MIATTTMTGSPSDLPSAPPTAATRGGSRLLSDESTIELVIRGRDGDRKAVEALLERCVPYVRRFAHGRLPAAARGSIDTSDLVQEIVLHVLRRLDVFVPRHVGAMQAYLRQSVINRVRDEVRKVGRHPAPAELPEHLVSDAASPHESAVMTEAVERYQAALMQVSGRDRELIVARIELQWSHAEIAAQFGLQTPDAARMAVGRALRRMMALLPAGTSSNC